MKNKGIINSILYSIIKVFIFGFAFVVVVLQGGYAVPSYDKGFAKHFEKNEVYQINVNHELSFKDNIKCVFFPNEGIARIDGINCANAYGGQLWDVFRTIMIGIIFGFLVFIGIRLLISEPDSEKDKIKQALKSLYYIAFGALIFFGAVWIIQTIFPVAWSGGSKTIMDNLVNGPTSIFYKIIALLKTLVYFIAIIMMTIYGFKIMAATDKADEAKKHMTGVVNIILALVFIKIIDYIYYIAQTKNFVTQAKDMIISISKILTFILGGGALVMVFYAGYLFLIDQGKGEQMTKAKNIFINVLLVSLVIFLFLLITYQILAEFA